MSKGCGVVEALVTVSATSSTELVEAAALHCGAQVGSDCRRDLEFYVTAFSSPADRSVTEFDSCCRAVNHQFGLIAQEKNSETEVTIIPAAFISCVVYLPLQRS